MDFSNIYGFICILGTLSLFMAENGGIVDDCIITNIGNEKFYLVSNASTAETILKHIKVCQAVYGPYSVYILTHLNI